ncbi:MAG: oxidoreductase, partial [Flavobacteriales bacterium]|nr:oxidoreductase [Flavobacteriales bacterium]
MKKVVLVTGASSGIGKATAQQLIKEGHIVYGAARRVEKMSDLESAGGYAVKMDVTNEDEVQAAVDKIIAEQGRIDVLVNNAGYAVYGPVEHVSMEDAKRQFDVNIFGLASITQKVIPHMRTKKSGTVINISSIGGKIYTPFGAWYHATKFALEGWSDCLRLELKDFGIDVVVVEPGAIKTEFMDVMYQPMVERGTGTVYETSLNLMAQAAASMEESGQGSPPSVIAETISKAVKSPKPKTRYASGAMAKMLLRMRRWTS